MSTIEDQLARDIAATTQGVVVTDSDLREARAAIDDRISSRQHEGHRRTTLIAAAAVVVLLLGVAAYLTPGGDNRTAPPAGPGPSPTQDITGDTAFLAGSAPTAEGIRGVWRLDNGGVLLRFAEPDLVFWDRGGRLFKGPAVQGRYQIDGDRIVVTVDGGSAGCAGERITLRAALMPNTNLHLVHTAQSCGSPTNARWAMEHLLPAGSIMANLVVHEDKGWEPLPADIRFPGTWMAEGSRHLLEFGEDGTYHVAAGSGEQVDYGDWQREGRELTLTSRADSAQCSSGDRLVISDIEHENPGTDAVRGTVRENTCDAPWTPKAWILVPFEER